MKSLILVFMLAMAPVKAHAIGWFLLGMALAGSGGDDAAENNNITRPSMSFMEVRGCRNKNKVILRESEVKTFVEDTEENRVVIYTYNSGSYCLLHTTLDKVKAKYFAGGK